MTIAAAADAATAAAAAAAAASRDDAMRNRCHQHLRKLFSPQNFVFLFTEHVFEI